MIKRPRRQTFPLETYLKRISDGKIRSDQDVQRLSGQWDKNMKNELMVTVLTDGYIPPVILGEDEENGIVKEYIIEGLQRSTSLLMFKYGNYKVTSNVEDYILEYPREGTDENGNVVCEMVQFDVRNKTYSDLPEELKNKFDEYQLETVIHENCSMEEMSKLVRRYNNHKPMNTAQRAFTYADHFARQIREITDTDFFRECGAYTEKERINGALERVVLESVMCMFHLNDWKKQTKQISIYLNENASYEEFAKLQDNLGRLEKIVSDDVGDIFTGKDSFIWIALFDKFVGLGLDDGEFAAFLREFKQSLRGKAVNGRLYDDIDKNKGTKDKTVIKDKLKMLETLMTEFLYDREDVAEADILQFVKQHVNADATQEDVDLYRDMYEDYTLNVDNHTRLLEKENLPSMVGMVAYACDHDIDLDHWFVWYFSRHKTYRKDQARNYRDMVSSLERYKKET